MASLKSRICYRTDCTFTAHLELFSRELVTKTLLWEDIFLKGKFVQFYAAGRKSDINEGIRILQTKKTCKTRTRSRLSQVSKKLLYAPKHWFVLQ
jgi:hypothetical protein